MSDPTIRDGWPDDWRPTKLQAALAKLDASCDRLDRAAKALREAGRTTPAADDKSVQLMAAYGRTQCHGPNPSRPPARAWSGWTVGGQGRLVSDKPCVQSIPRSSVNYFIQQYRAWQLYSRLDWS